MQLAEFTREDILRVAADEGYTHSVIGVLIKHDDHMRSVSEKSASISGDQRAERVIETTSQTLIEGIEQAKPFDLHPLDMVAIWARVMRYPKYRYLMAKTIPISWATQGVKNNEIWRNVPWDYIKATTGLRIPKRVMDDKEGLVYVRDRLTVVYNNYHLLQCVEYESDPPPTDRLVDVVNTQKWTAETRAEIERLRTLINNKRIPIVGNMGEALGNGVSSIFMNLSDTIKTPG